MSDPQGPAQGALDPHPYFQNKHYNGISSTDLTTHLKSSPLTSWLPPPEDHPRLSDTFQEMRYLELQNWDLNSYNETLTPRLVDSRDQNDTQINYRPWEKPDSSTQQPQPQTPATNGIKQENGVSSTNSPEKASPPTLTPLTNAFPTFTDTFQPPQKLPSFQSQFNAFTDQQLEPPPPPPPPSLPSFHTLPANRYAPPHQLPIPPPPTQYEERIQLFPHHHNIPPQFPTIITTQNGTTHTTPTYHVNMNGTTNYTPVIPSTSAPTLQIQELVPVPPMHTLIHPSAINVQRALNQQDNLQTLNLNIIDQNYQHQQIQTQPVFKNYIAEQPQIIAVKLQPYDPKPQNGVQNGTPHTERNDQRTPPQPQKQKKRKRTENGTNGHEQNAHQVSSSTDQGYKRPNLQVNNIKHVNGNGHTNGHEDALDKPVKKKRKRCGECIGCQRKDNCGECAPCRNDKSHQICKQRRCDKLTEKKTPKSKLKNQVQHH